MRRLLVLLFMLVPVAACSTSSKSDATTTTIAPTTTAAPTVATVPRATADATIKISAYVVGVNLKQQTITVDPIGFLTGAAAVTAYQHDNPGATGGPENDYYITNPTKDRVELKFPPQASVKLLNVDGVELTKPVAVAQSKLIGYASLATRPFEITSALGTVHSVAERFIP